MDAYIFNAKLYCVDCTEDLTERLTCPGDMSDERTYDSKDYPKGPYADGGGEADCPQNCGGCGVFLENPLTRDGEEYVREAMREDMSPVVREWAEFYDISC